MKKRLNKIPTNYTVALTPQEVTNLSETLSAVRTAGGGTGGVYIGDGQYIGVDNTNNRISFLPDAATTLESVSDKLDKDFETDFLAVARIIGEDNVLWPEEDYIEFLKNHFYDVCEEMEKYKNYDLEDAIKKLIWVLADLAIFENEGCYESEFIKKLGYDAEINNDIAYEIFYETETMIEATEKANKLLKK